VNCAWISTTTYLGDQLKVETAMPAKSVTAMNIPAHATLTWRYFWPLGMSAEEYVMTVSTTPWGAAVSSANLSTSNTQRGTSETLTSVKNVHVTQLVLRMGESVMVTPIFLLVSSLVSVGVNCTWKESIVIFAKRASMT
jgi:hypothetical protein